MTPVSLILTLSRAANEGRAAAATSCIGCSCSLAGGELKGAQSCISMENGEPRKMGIGGCPVILDGWKFQRSRSMPRYS
ncbi:hypothetical protein CTAM01_11302 [Colletotrichum tamarilloi]|uniref:Secreted protein n=1 Tax=Colletotrichum tamarilloi TaxID=1209934 RepID=A0ABQ9QY75_9PEZI|nr:uncharacterized protein CTAM01_11302 [Colletotrichum tamarilloi]KAI3541262.1 hypothetical protein CSPX01_07621 [Colletotrichum filicis]KAK1488978.1 hypothetical protein CTAM01_11302 [Colletotrichum tamarilloi]